MYTHNCSGFESDYVMLMLEFSVLKAVSNNKQKIKIKPKAYISNYSIELAHDDWRPCKRKSRYKSKFNII